MSVVLAVALLPVALYCAFRALSVRGSADDGHHRDVDAWHAVLGAAMVPMVLGRLTGSAAVVVLALAGVGLTWSVLSVERTGGAAYARLAVTGAATALMTLPLASPAGATSMTSGHGGALGGPSWDPVVAVLVVALAVVVLSAARLVVRRRVAVAGRLDAGCDAVMAVAMALMLLGLS